MNSETKTCQNCRQPFTIEPDDFTFYEKMAVPPPTWCPECRFMRRLMWRNEHNLFKRTCAATKKTIFTMFHPDAPVVVYDYDYWWSDKWDAMTYGREYDFSRPFFEQFKELLREVPWLSRSAFDLENSDYCMTCHGLKNCYLTFDSNTSEGCLYNVSLTNVKDSVDNLLLLNSELCYENFAGADNARAFYSIDCSQSYGLWFCEECNACSDCVGCRNLRHKQHHIFNKPYSKEEYEEEVKKFRLNTRSGREAFAKRFREFSLSFPIKYSLESHNVDCTGDFVTYSKNVKNSYLVRGGENLRYCQSLYSPPGARDCYDYTVWGSNAERIYESCQVGNGVADLKFCNLVYPGERMEYSLLSPASSDMFGCVGLKKKSYCILNKQYTPEAYKELVARIKKHMDEMPYVDAKGRTYGYGEFFPPELSPFAYNETLAQEYFPLTKQTAGERGFLWREPAERPHQPTRSWRDLPETIGEVSDSITEDAILCRTWDEDPEGALHHNCTKAFRITPAELAFYRRFDIPLPDRCFYSRHHERTKRRNPLKLWPGTCMCAGTGSTSGAYRNSVKHDHGDAPCGTKYETTFAPDRPEVVYCNECFWKEFL